MMIAYLPTLNGGLKEYRRIPPDSLLPQRPLVSFIFAIARDPSPNWHRKQRKRRSTARSLVKRLRLRPRITSGKLQRLGAALDLLQAHHTRPVYSLPTCLRSSLSRSMSKRWTTSKGNGNPWPGWSPQWPQNRRSKGGKNDKGKGDGDLKEAKSKDALPLSYSSVQVQDAAPPGGQGAQAFMDAFMKIVQDHKTEVPEALQSFMPDPEREDMKIQQKRLNRLRTIKQKVLGKEKALAKDEQQWYKWLDEVKNVIGAQKTQHEETQERLKKEIEELKAEEEKIKKEKNGNDMEMSEEEMKEESVEDMLDELRGQSKVEPQAGSQQDMEKKIQEMQVQLQENFENRLMAAQQEMAKRYEQQLENDRKQLQQALAAMPGAPTVVVDLENELDGLDGMVDPQNVPNGYGASRVKTKSEASPYRKTEPRKGQTSMQDRLQKSHGSKEEKEKENGSSG